MSTPNKICIGTSKSNDDDVCEVNDMLQHMTTADKEDEIVTNMCANCGKEGSDVNNTCNKCKSVMYCNAACKKKHRHKHKKDCEDYLRLTAERAAKLHDKTLFKQPPQQEEDCPICFLRIPSLCSGSKFKACCGKIICSGCIHAVELSGEDALCPFCRTPTPESEEMIELTKKRVEAGDVIAMNSLGGYFAQGEYGYPQDYDKALELWHRAGELGYADAHYNIACAYNNGLGVEIDEQRVEHYCELAAIGGHSVARHKLGYIEVRKGNMDRAIKHLMIAVNSGDAESLKNMQQLYSNGHVIKDDYAKGLRAYQAYLNEVKSAQRDEAAAYDDDYKYIE